MSDSPVDNDDHVPDETKHCLQCGTVLAADETGEICSACMLEVGFESHAIDPDATEGGNDSAEPVSADELTIKNVQKLFPDLEILELVGQGGMGMVYKAQQKHLGRLVALKLLRTKCSQDPSLAERFSREARALAKLAHPHIVGVHDFGQAGDRPYLIMEYVDGTNLRQMMSEKTLTPQAALAMIAPICEALQFAHEEGVVHRDIKPENILVDRRGRVRIADFGLARLMGRNNDEWTLTGTRQVMGTPHYMAPEQMERPQEVDHRADIFSLGVVLYEMLTGELPIGRFDLPSKKLDIDVRLDQVVLRTLEKEPSRRYQHASDIQTDVQRIAVLGERTTLGSYFDLSQPAIVVPAIAFCVAAFLNMVVGTSSWITFFADRPHDEYAFLGFTHLAAMIPLAWGGWKMLTGGPSKWMLVAAIAGLIPVHFGAFISLPFSIWVLYLVGTGKQVTTKLSSQSSHEVDLTSLRLAEGAQRLRSVGIGTQEQIGRILGSGWRRISAWPWRRLARTVVACTIWLCGCVAAVWGYYAFYGHATFPSTVIVSDRSTEQVKIRSTADLYLRITASGVVDAQGFSELPAQPLRKQVKMSLYRAISESRIRKFYSSEGFFANLVGEGNWEYDIDTAESYDGVAVHPKLLRADELELWNVDGMSRVYGPRSSFAVGVRQHEYFPPLEDGTPLQAWLEQAGIEPEECQRLATSMIELLRELGNDGGMASDSSGQVRLKPLAAMLDFTLLQPQGNGKLQVSFVPSQSAVLLWGGVTGAVAISGCILLIWLTFRRAERRSIPEFDDPSPNH
ncbi:MAG: serine/threonine-protein kinase [Pirellulaceae bacterium]